MKVFSILRIIFGLLPAIRDGIVYVEAALPGKGKGEMKLAMVREIIESILSVTGNGAVMPVITRAIDKIVTRIVGEYNKDGWPEPEEVTELEIKPVEEVEPKRRR